MSEAALLDKLRDRAPEAFEELVREYGSRLLSVSLRILRNKEDAEDAVQNAFAKVFQSIDSFRGDASLYTWLYRIVKNESLMKIRETSRVQVVDVEEFLPRYEHGQHRDSIQDWTHFPDLRLETKELASFYEQCIDELPEPYRMAYILKDVEKLSEDDVCRILELKKGAMKNRVHRARLVIRKRVEQFLSESTR